jgi:hypothetical protein
VAKFDEALGANGLDTASLDVLESYAQILERAGKREQAVATYETIQRRDVQRTDLTAKISTLRSELATAAVRAPGRTAPTESGESRYELLAEIGRGGMGVGVQGARQAARPRRRAEAPAREPARAPDRGRALRARGARRRRAEPPQHRHDLRRGPGRTAPTSSRWSCSRAAR